MNCRDTLQQLSPSPPSVQAVFCALASHTPLTAAQLREATGLPRRTVYAALQRLKQIGVLHERVSLKDSRQTYFWLDAGATAGTDEMAAAA